MSAESTVVVEGEVHLVIIRTNHLTAAVVTVSIFNGIEVAVIQIVETKIFTTCRCVKVLTGAITFLHGVKRIRCTILIGLVCIDTLRVRELYLQALQNFAPSEVVVNTTADVEGRGLAIGEVTIILQSSEVVVLVLYTGTIRWTVAGNSVFFYILWHIARTGQHQVVVLLCIGTTHLQERFLLVAVVTADSQVGS